MAVIVKITLYWGEISSEKFVEGKIAHYFFVPIRMPLRVGSSRKLP